MTTKVICLSIDVEEDLPGVVPYGTRGVQEGLPNLLRLLEQMHIEADFFFLSSVALSDPDLVRDIESRGHGIGNHGWDHRFLCRKSSSVQQQEIRKSTQILEGIASQELRMFRAPGFSVNSATMQLLQGEGYAVDSSVLPGRFMRRFGILPIYDHRGAPREPHFPIATRNDINEARLLEIPVAENPRLRGAPLGLGALNAFGPIAALDAVRTAEMKTVVFLIHPWELIDLRATYPGLPAGYARACSPDLANLRDFLREVREFATFATLAGVRQEFAEA